MNVINFIHFLGHSSIYEPFDDFLTSQDIKWRPKVGRDLDTTYFVNGHGLVLTFDLAISAEEKGFKVKSDGDYVFKYLSVRFIANDKKHGLYAGPMLHSLAVNDSRAEVEKKLGVKPTRTLERSDNYFMDDLVWTTVFQNNKIEFITLEIPRDGHRKNGLCP
jgi:hypothetical protein